ncbi:MAG TPA: prolyl oligopeptidase family serine peptidase [Longimicrobium sp.]|uniref:alpha/beta hydrolase family protein n=1 Tax=Longimicrobium sp. TaxID=2029185 RepID=UPI002EDA6D24
MSAPARQELLDGLFAPPTEAERAAIERDWESRPAPEPRGVRVELEKREKDGRRTLVVSHLVNGNRHYGAVRIPAAAPEKRLPVLVVAHGGDKGASGYHFFHHGALADEWIQVVPSFRSEPLLLTPFRAYRSEGLANPWDGDVDDTMQLLSAVLGLLPQADSSRVAVFGHSRGGGVALLMGERDPRIRAVVSVAGPTDLFLPDIRRVATRGLSLPLPRLPGANYLADSVLFALRDGRTTLPRARLEMLRRSPAWFAHRLPPTQVHHGALDNKVAFAHGERLAAFAGQVPGRTLEFHAYPAGKHRTRTLDGAVARAEEFLMRTVANASTSSASP